ncbi:MAG: hypothetical protein PVS3B3_31380 [Ktedonobacteraceae bacterium]
MIKLDTNLVHWFFIYETVEGRELIPKEEGNKNEALPRTPLDVASTI